jgi:hypothetical protein
MSEATGTPRASEPERDPAPPAATADAVVPEQQDRPEPAAPPASADTPGTSETVGSPEGTPDSTADSGSEPGAAAAASGASEPEPVEQPTPPDPDRHPAPQASDQAPLHGSLPANWDPRRHAPPQAQVEYRPVVLESPHHDWWEMPPSPAPRWLLIACLAVAVFGGYAAFHADGVGIGFAITGLGLLAVPFIVGARPSGSQTTAAVLIAALWAVAAVRDAAWITTLCGLAALFLMPIALASPRSFAGMIRAFLLSLVGSRDAARWHAAGTKGRSGTGAGRKIVTVAVTIGLLIVFGALFAGADVAFAQLIRQLIPQTDVPSFVLRTMLACTLFLLVALWAYLAASKPRFDPAEPFHPRRRLSRFELALPLTALNGLFGAFLGVQARTFFGDEAYVMETAGLTFAEYARTGFWQLSVVAMLALAVIAFAAWKAPREERADRMVARTLLGALSVMTLVVVASALVRMTVYYETYGLTRLRLWVFAVEIWLAVLFVLVLAALWTLRTTWLPRAAAVSGVALLLGLAAINPDGFIARYNVDRYEESGRFDLRYAASLSADAVPALADLPEDLRACVFRWGRWDTEPDTLWSVNLGQSRGASIAAEIDSGIGPDCASKVGHGDDGGQDRSSTTDRSDAASDRSESDEHGTASVNTEVPPSGFFNYETCTRLDMSAVEVAFGTSAKGDYGVVPDNGAHGGYVLGSTPPAGSIEAWAALECGFYGPGTRYVSVDVKAWANAEAAQDATEWNRSTWESYIDAEVADYEGIGGNGFTAHTPSDSSMNFIVLVVVDNLTLSFSATGLPERLTDVAYNVIAQQLLPIYREYA